MRLTSISIKNFKSIKSLELYFSDNLYCLIGKNEIGKSNILQAISLFSPLKEMPTGYAAEKFNRIINNATIIAKFEVKSNRHRQVVAALLRFFRPITSPNHTVSVNDVAKY